MEETVRNQWSKPLNPGTIGVALMNGSDIFARVNEIVGLQAEWTQVASSKINDSVCALASVINRWSSKEILHVPPSIQF